MSPLADCPSFPAGSGVEEHHVLPDGLAAEVARLKGGNGKDIIVYGGPTFASSLLNAGLIDEFHLFVNPTVLGSGRSMFKDLGSNTNLKLLGAMPFDCGVVVIQYVRGG